MGKTEKLKEWIDWLRRIDFFVGLLVALGAGRAVNAMLISFTKIPQIWISPIWLLSSGLALAAIIFVAEKMPSHRFIDTSPLRKEVVRLGQDLFAFLREVGPDPGNQLDYLHSTEEVWKRMSEKTGPYIERVRHGYLSRFKDRVPKTIHELALKGIKDKEIEELEIDTPQAVKSESVRKIAEHMFLIAAQMDIKELSKGT
jgi:hypothetical protein